MTLTQDIVSHELPDIAELVRVVAERESERCGHYVSTHSQRVQLGVASIILNGVGRALRRRYERAAGSVGGYGAPDASGANLS